jgi:hypothetical protein
MLDEKNSLDSFEPEQSEWGGYELEYFKDYPFVQWKLLNLKNRQADSAKVAGRSRKTMECIRCFL